MIAFLTRLRATDAGGPLRSSTARPVGAWAFAGVALTSFGGPLALAALYAPGIVAGPGTASAGLTVVAVVFSVYGLWAVLHHSSS